jgi:hypothetical protein
MKFFLQVLLCLLLSVIIVMFATGCQQVPKIEADLWAFDSSDGTVYRTLDNGNEQFFRCTQKVAEDYIAIHKKDAEKWFIYFRKNCVCSSVPASGFSPELYQLIF